MNREIKFRVWNKEVQSYLKQYNNSDCIGVRYVGVINSLCRDTMFRQEDCIFEQYTGLKDINSIDIYEGDIVVQYPDNRVYQKVCEHLYVEQENQPKKQIQDIIVNIGFVQYITPSFMLQYLQNKPDGACATYLEYNTPYEVIGNIHENPELLKQ